MKTEAGRDFEPVTNPKDAVRLLTEGGKTMASVILWTREQESVLNTHLTLYKEAEKLLYVWVPKETDPEEFIRRVGLKSDGECYFSVSLSSANLFFKAKLVEYSDGIGLKFRVPERLYRVQRRKDLRFAIPDGHVLRAEFEDPLFPEKMLSHKMLDISAGGAGILIPEDEAPIFQNGMTLNNFHFTITGKKIQCEAEVRHIRKLPPQSRQSGINMGVLFKKLRASDEQLVAQYVFEETRKFYSRFIE